MSVSPIDTVGVEEGLPYLKPQIAPRCRPFPLRLLRHKTSSHINIAEAAPLSPLRCQDYATRRDPVDTTTTTRRRCQNDLDQRPWRVVGTQRCTMLSLTSARSRVALRKRSTYMMHFLTFFVSSKKATRARISSSKCLTCLGSTAILWRAFQTSYRKAHQHNPCSS